LTRSGDSTLSLDDRVQFANNKKADFFISIHVNASTSSKDHGIETFYLNNASDRASKVLAIAENRSEGRNTTDLEKIIATMMQNASADESRDFAKVVHSSLVNTLSGKYPDVNDQKVKTALFYVLVGVKCPSILVETAYISNPKREKGSKIRTINRWLPPP